MLLDYALGRIVSVIIAVLLGLLLAIVFFPGSATDLAVQEMRKAVQGCIDLHDASLEAIGDSWLEAAELMAAVKEEEEEEEEEGRAAEEAVIGRLETVLEAAGTAAGAAPLPPNGLQTAAQRSEAAHLAVAKAIRAVEDNMATAANELFVGGLKDCYMINHTFPKWLSPDVSRPPHSFQRAPP